MGQKQPVLSGMWRADGSNRPTIAKQCPQCHQEIYPRISPAIIVLIKKGSDSVLLVHARNFRGTFKGLVAGFLEPGETLEECVCREVMEETRLRIKNLKYFGSQPWPYPSGIMIGYVAEYESGTIRLQDEELNTGAFLRPEPLAGTSSETQHCPPDDRRVARRKSIIHKVRSFRDKMLRTFPVITDGLLPGA